jgi:hypothetical protein
MLPATIALHDTRARTTAPNGSNCGCNDQLHYRLLECALRRDLDERIFGGARGERTSCGWRIAMALRR